MTTDRSGRSRLREFWNKRYSSFTLSESGWLGAGEASQRADIRVQAAGAARDRSRRSDSIGAARWSVLDAGCGQGHFARFYRREYPAAAYVGIDISERAVAHLRGSIEGAEFHVADLCQWDDPRQRTFDIVQSLEVLHLILDDAVVARAIEALASRLSARTARC